VRAPRPVVTERQPLTVDQVRTLLRATRGHRLHALFVAVAVLGLRRSELLGLRWEDLDLDEGVLRVRRGLHRVNGELTVMPTKTRRSERVVPLPALVVRALQEHRQRQEVERAADRKSVV